MRLERFTDKAQEAFQEAQEIMHEQHHTQLDVEHIFLAMLRQKDGLASRALDRLGVDPDTISLASSVSWRSRPKFMASTAMATRSILPRAPSVWSSAPKKRPPA
jgi:ATP-dependent Clp protease ATP-binding subunit ClpC